MSKEDKMNKHQRALNNIENKLNENRLNKSLFDTKIIEVGVLQKLIDKENKMSKLHEEIYNAYHHGTKEEFDKKVSELIYQIEYDWEM